MLAPPSTCQRQYANPHRECLFSEATAILSSLQCPSCTTPLGPPSGSSSSAAPAPVLTTYTSEGGTEQNLDIHPVLREESYLDSNPQSRPARALHLMASEGDVHGAVELLHSLQDDGETASLPALLHYQDPLAGMKSTLHVAVAARREDTVWLLLWLASGLPEGAFPDESRALAEAIGLGRLPAEHGDIRSLRDADGKTAEALAQDAEELAALREAGALAPPS